MLSAKGCHMKISRRGAVAPFRILEAFNEAMQRQRDGHDMIHLTLGQPGCEAPLPVRQAAAKALLEQPLGYTESPGWLPLRQRIVQFYAERYGVELPLERVFITVGSSSAFFMSVIAAFDSGDRVAILQPCYPAYPNMLRALDVEPVFLRGSRENNFQPTVEMLEALARKPDGLIIASPSNPSGTVMRAGEVERLARYCDEQGIRLISDEIYHGVTYGAKPQSVAAISSRSIVVNSFSKYFLLPGWRLGWTVMAEDLVPSFNALSQNFFISPSAIAQYAALETFNQQPLLNAEVAKYRINRDIMLEALPRAGFTDLAEAEGAFYIYADVRKLTNDSEAFCRRMVVETGVVAVSGLDFDAQEGRSYVRFSFSGDTAVIVDAMARLERWLA